jgi:hypothetical protein
MAVLHVRVLVVVLGCEMSACASRVARETQARSTVGVYYTFLGSGGFGAVR